jgi:hypothetical protein
MIDDAPEQKPLSIFDRMRNVLQPRGTAEIVGLSMEGVGNTAYFSKAFVHSCIDLLEKKALLAQIGVEPLNDLEKLAAQLLMDSAYIDLTKEKGPL